MINKIKDNVWQLHFRSFGSCVYLIKYKENNILIDTGSSLNTSELIEDLEKLNIKPLDIDILLLSHYHFDHAGNVNLFENAKIYGSKEDFKDTKILDLDKLNIKEIEVIKTPGHSKGSVCFLFGDVLFSGDTIFDIGIGRTDLPNSSPEDMVKSLKKLERVDYKILCPGHVD